MTFVALEDAYGLHIVGGNALVTVAKAAEAMRAGRRRTGLPDLAGVTTRSAATRQ
jgi:hypothetical protein